MTAIREERALAISRTNLNHVSIPSTRFSMHETQGGIGVRVAEIRQDSREVRLVYNPSHPDANEEGYVAMPNINVIEEMTNMINATRAYEANATAFNSTKQMMMAVFQG
jgi:flagellar basal-body rod protein FlgC